MKEDLIFHLASEKQWKENKGSAVYTPESLESEGYIHCCTGEQLQETANRFYNGEKKLLLIVINTALVDQEIKYEQDPESGEEHPHIYGPLTLGAVIDKIKLRPETDGNFEISFISD